MTLEKAFELFAFHANILKVCTTFYSIHYPYLKFDPFVLAEDGLDFEINANSGNKGRSERVVGVAEEEAGLAHRAVANDQQLEHVVKVLVGSVFLPGSTLCRHL